MSHGLEIYIDTLINWSLVSECSVIYDTDYLQQQMLPTSLICLQCTPDCTEPSEKLMMIM